MVWTLVIEESNPVSDLDTEAPPVLVPPGERVVVFFFPLESGFGWPPGEPIQVYRTAHPSLLDAIRSLSRTGLDVGSYPATVLAASLICHEVPVNVAERNGFTAMMRAFGLGFPHLEESSKSEEPQLETSAAVVEVIIPLITSAAIRLVDEEATDIELSDPLGRPDDWLGEAFDMAVDHVRELQRQFAAVTRLPTRLLSRQQLPPMIVYGVRKFNALEPGEVSSGIFLVHNRLETLGPPLVLSEERQAAMLDVERSMHASAYLDLYNQADVALNLDGNLREAAVMIATASEVLLNRLILTMRWEEGTTPEDSARDWPDSLTTRIARELPHRVGGNWSLDEGSEAPRRWYRDVYSLRNRVAHSGYEPTFEEASAAQRTLNELIAWIGDRVQSGARLKRYPRTVSMLYTSRIHERIGRLPWLKAMQDDPTEVPWSSTSAAWIDAHNRCVQDADQKRQPEAERAELASLWMSGQTEPVQWILTHKATGLGCEVEVDRAIIRLPTDRGFIATIPEGHTALLACPRRQGDLLSHGPWVEAYHLDPRINVMVDRSDRDQPWPLDAPRR